jgi:hypothetical protein
LLRHAASKARKDAETISIDAYAWFQVETDEKA